MGKKEEEDKLPFESAHEASKVFGFLDTGNFALNYAISGQFSGGWPLGHVSEIFGDNSTGKSYVILRAISQAQVQGGDTMLDDTENAFNEKWAQEHLGVNPHTLRYTSSLTIEDHRKVVEAYAQWCLKHKVKLAVCALDSIAVLSTEHELTTPDKRDLTRASEVRKMWRILKHQVRQVPMAYLITNHIIANIGDLYNPQTTPTGSGTKFHAGTRVFLRGVHRLKVPDTKPVEYRGVVVDVFVEKNRFGPPFKACQFVIPFYEPINPLSGLIPVLLNVGYLGTNAGHYLVGRDGSSTGIHAYLTDIVRQDVSAAQLMDKYPDLLQEADDFLLEQEAQVRLTGQEVPD